MRENCMTCRPFADVMFLILQRVLKGKVEYDIVRSKKTGISTNNQVFTIAQLVFVYDVGVFTVLWYNSKME